MNKNFSLKIEPSFPRLALMALTLHAGSSLSLGQEKIPEPPDLLKGGTRDQTHDWNLGPTGARGWIFGYKGETTSARQILVTEVAKGSPAEGALAPGDVILGIGDRPFDGDARKALARAITAAERPENRGQLRVMRRRGSQTGGVTIKLAPLGAFAASAPYSCSKSEKILDKACLAIVQRGFKNQRQRAKISIENDLNALALLASGDPQYLPLVADYARAVAEATPGGHISWGYGYETLFLAEYVLATHDQEAMKGLRRLALDIAEGQSTVGNWGHAFRRVPQGDLKGYGAMNQTGIVLTLAMAIAREAGVKSLILDEAIARSAAFLRWYVDKGAIPYGDHDPWPWHEDNGKCSAAAILFDLLGDAEASGFFARMAVAAYSERESGHTGNFFNHLWAAPGVARAGPAATAAYFVEAGWELELARAFDGSFPYQPTPADWGGDSYNGWDCTGAYALHFALPLRKTILTGKRPFVPVPLEGTALQATIDAGRDFSYWTEENPYAQKSLEALFAGLSSWSPAVRTRSATALATRSGGFTARLAERLASDDRFTRYGAAEALARLGKKADPLGNTLRTLLADPDPWLRILAAQAISELSPEQRKKSVPALLLATQTQDPKDPRQRVASALGEALFDTAPGKRGPAPILGKSLDGVDRPALYAAIRTLLANEDGRIRSYVAPVLRVLDDSDFGAVLPALLDAVRHRPPSGQMFAYEIRMVGLELLAKRSIREGLDLAWIIINEDEWGRDFDKAGRALLHYGSAAKSLIPRLETETRAWAKEKGEKLQASLDNLLTKLRAAPSGQALVSAEDFVRRHQAP